MLKLALFDPRKRRVQPEAPGVADSRHTRPGAHDDFKPTQPAVLNVETPSRRGVPPSGAATPPVEAMVPQPGARMTLAR